MTSAQSRRQARCLQLAGLPAATALLAPAAVVLTLHDQRHSQGVDGV